MRARDHNSVPSRSKRWRGRGCAFRHVDRPTPLLRLAGALRSLLSAWRLVLRIIASLLLISLRLGGRMQTCCRIVAEDAQPAHNGKTRQGRAARGGIRGRFCLASCSVWATFNNHARETQSMGSTPTPVFLLRHATGWSPLDVGAPLSLAEVTSSSPDKSHLGISGMHHAWLFFDADASRQVPEVGSPLGGGRGGGTPLDNTPLGGRHSAAPPTTRKRRLLACRALCHQ